MILKGFIRKGEYFDSVSLMIVSREITKIPEVIDSAIVMGTGENRDILSAAGLLLPVFANTSDTDLLIAVKAEDDLVFDDLLSTIDELFQNLRSGSEESEDFNPHSLAGGLKQMPEANLSLISIPGKYAAVEAMKALEKGLHVMLFSDNVSLIDELKLKQYAAAKELFVMGPDCGTAIINGVPLAFANVVDRGDIGIVAASGTGLQEVSSLISNLGSGVSQAIGTGGRDVKQDIGGIMFLQGIKALENDPSTNVITLISKPPDDVVLKQIGEELKSVKKPVVAIFIGGNPDLMDDPNIFIARNLEEAAFKAVSLSQNIQYDPKQYPLKETMLKINETSVSELKSKTSEQKYVRGLYSGGTLCDEAQLIFREKIGQVYSNTPLDPEFLLEDPLKSRSNTVIDLGDDLFTVGKPHPMIDFSLRISRINSEIKDPEVAVILIDLVLGYGSNPDPMDEFIPSLAAAKKQAPQISFISSVTGTEGDPQNRELVVEALQKAGVLVCNSNAEAAFLTTEILTKLGGK